MEHTVLYTSVYKLDFHAVNTCVRAKPALGMTPGFNYTPSCTQLLKANSCLSFMVYIYYAQCFLCTIKCKFLSAYLSNSLIKLKYRYKRYFLFYAPALCFSIFEDNSVSFPYIEMEKEICKSKTITYLRCDRVNNVSHPHTLLSGTMFLFYRI